MVIGLVSWLSFTNHSDSESFLMVYALISQDGCQWKVFWEVVGQKVSPFNLSQTLLVSDVLYVPCSLTGPPVVKITQADGYYGAWPGWVVSISVLPIAVFHCLSFSEGSMVKNPPTNAEAARSTSTGLISGSERPPGRGNGNLLQCSCLENPMNRGAWWATVRGVAKSQAGLSG